MCGLAVARIANHHTVVIEGVEVASFPRVSPHQFTRRFHAERMVPLQNAASLLIAPFTSTFQTSPSSSQTAFTKVNGMCTMRLGWPPISNFAIVRAARRDHCGSVGRGTNGPSRCAPTGFFTSASRNKSDGAAIETEYPALESYVP
jgi:hypothetical protein